MRAGQAPISKILNRKYQECNHANFQNTQTFKFLWKSWKSIKAGQVGSEFLDFLEAMSGTEADGTCSRGSLGDEELKLTESGDLTDMMYVVMCVASWF